MNYAQSLRMSLNLAILNVLLTIVLYISTGHVSYGNLVLTVAFSTLHGFLRHCESAEKKRKLADEREKGRLAEEREKQLAIEARRSDTDSLGYRILSQFVDLGDTFHQDTRELQPVLRVNMDCLTDYQALLIDSYLDDAATIEAIGKENEEFSPEGRLHTEKIVREAAMHLSNALLQADLFTQQSDFVINQRASENGIILGGACDK